MLDPRAIATLGIGYAPASMARLGLWPESATQPPPQPSTRPASGIAGRAPRRRVENDEALLLILTGR